VAVLIVPTTAPEPIEAYAIRVVDAWRLGRAGSDDGALLLVAKDDRRLRIEVGRGLEGALTDLVSKRIIDETVVPHFRAGDYAAGVDAGVDRILAVIAGEPLPPPAPRPPAGGGGDWSPLFLLGFPLASVALRALLGLAGPFLIAAFAAGTAWLLTGQLPLALGIGAFTLLFGMAAGGGGRWSNRRRGARRRSGTFGGGGWGGGGFGGGGGGGGGFSGGGGGFGGGGASGSW
jgi:uncharacterized protein